jgi:hypothetical protein
MAEMKSITVRLELPGQRRPRSAGFCGESSMASAPKLTDSRIVYDNGRSECDVAWAARGMLLHQLTEAGFWPK